MGGGSDPGARNLIRSPQDRVSVLVHEVRSPVAALVAVAGALRETTDHVSRSELARLAIGACLAIERIVSDIAVASVRTVATDVGGIVRDAAAASRVGGAVVHDRIDADLPLVDADAIRLRQALDNLLVNAVLHAGTDDPIVVHARRSSTGGVAVSVEDAGAGIDAEALERIFEPGVRLAEERPGSGLGLALSRAIAEAHGGRLTVVSLPGGGTTFTIELPATGHPATPG